MSQLNTLNAPTAELSSADILLDKIRQGLIGKEQQIQTPFGLRNLCYADYTASGRSLDFIESSLQNSVMPFYANTHTEANATGQQTSAFREQARQQIRQAVNANDDDLVVFCGSGATSAINTLISQLGLRDLSPEQAKSVCVLLGPYEHHSNELPWRELGVTVQRIAESEQGGVCLQALEKALQAHQGKRIIGTFSAASNVTGILENQEAISQLLHRYQALSFWDFAAAAPYVKIDMNPAGNKALSKDALFFSMHKFVGGPGTPGILVVKKSLIANAQPSHIGGGTVSFVTPDDHQFLPVGERREEGGTPAILESIRAGLVMHLKQQVGEDTIEQRESELVAKIDQRWANQPNIERLGHAQAKRLSITAVRIKTPYGYLHHGFVTALLNDLFGLQVRGGCSCAGPYGHQLLNIDEAKSQRIQQALANQEKLVKPGWVRFNLNYFISDQEADFILQAFEFVANHGLAFLPYYAYDTRGDVWRFQNHQPQPMELENLAYQWFEPKSPGDKATPEVDCWQVANQLMADFAAGKYPVQCQPFNEQYADIKDFVLVQDLPA